jgi:hypothetical protein
LSLLSAHPVLETLPVCWNMPLCSLQDPETRRAFKERFGKGERDMIVPAGRTGIPHTVFDRNRTGVYPVDYADDLTEGLDTSSFPLSPSRPFGYRRLNDTVPLRRSSSTREGCSLSRNERSWIGGPFFRGPARFIP